MKAIVLKHREWDQIFQQIKSDYADSPATYLIRGRMRDVLGFTVREHQDWQYRSEEIPGRDYDWRDERSQIHIDFYNESARTYFIMKYMNND